MSAPAPYRDQVVPYVERALALIDRNPSSATYGCADRTFWQYRTLTNFPAASMQQVMLGLATLYACPRDDNPYFQDAELLAVTSATLSYWCKIQNTDGSFNEWYRNENSYCPTAFTAAGAALSLLALGDDLSADIRARTLQTLEHTARWLDTRFNPTVMNQNLVAALGLWALATLTGKDEWRVAAVNKYERISALQSKEGWVPEYGGFDFGYSTLALDLIAAADLLGADHTVRPLGTALAGMLASVSTHGLGYPGRLGSRGTAHVFPFGVEYFSSHSAEAAYLAERCREEYAQDRLPGPGQVDDRYFAYFYFPQFAQAYAYGGTATAPLSPAPAQDGETLCTEAGVNVRRFQSWSMTVSHKLGDALALQMHDQAPLYHLGYEITTDNGARFSNAHWDETPWQDRTAIAFSKVSGGQPLVKWAVPFHVLTSYLLRGKLSEWFQGTIKRIMIRPKTMLNCTLQRTFTAQDEHLVIQDVLRPTPNSSKITRIVPAFDISMHSPSARQDLANPLISIEVWPSEEICAHLNAGKTLHLSTSVHFENERPIIEKIIISDENGKEYKVLTSK